MQFAQVFGFPLRVGRYGAEATPDEKDVLLRAVRNIAQDAAAIIPDSMRIEFVNTNSTGNIQIFKGLTEYFDKQISKAVLGQTGTTDVGQHVGTANAHERVREDIEESDAAQLAATLSRDLVRPLVDLNLGPRRRYPAIRIVREKEEDASAWIDNVVKAAAVAPDFAEVSVVRDKLGIPQPAQGAATIGASPAKTEEDAPDKEAPRVKTAQSVQAARPAPEPDAIDLAVKEELGDWQPLVSLLVDPILELADRCSSYDEFLAGLPDAMKKQDPEPLARTVSFAMMNQHVRGRNG